MCDSKQKDYQYNEPGGTDVWGGEKQLEARMVQISIHTNIALRKDLYLNNELMDLH